MRIFMTGGTGFVGTTLTRELIQQGHQVTVLTRKSRSAPAPGGAQGGVFYVEGDPTRPGPWQEEVPGHDGIINLAGASIFRKWDREAKELIRESRVQTTANLVEALSRGPRQTRILISTSAVGYYGFRGDEELDEASPPGDDFLSSVTQDWERTAARAESSGVRVVTCRLGIVLGRSGGALAELVPLFRKGLGSPLGTGKQWMSWIHEQDLVHIYRFLMAQNDLSGPVNCTAPHPVTNKEMTQALARAMGKPILLPAVPGFILKMVKGEFGSILLEGQRVLPKRLLRLGYQFRFPDIDTALKDLVEVG